MVTQRDHCQLKISLSLLKRNSVSLGEMLNLSWLHPYFFILPKWHLLPPKQAILFIVEVKGGLCCMHCLLSLCYPCPLGHCVHNGKLPHSPGVYSPPVYPGGLPQSPATHLTALLVECRRWQCSSVFSWSCLQASGSPPRLWPLLPLGRHPGFPTHSP